MKRDVDCVCPVRPPLLVAVSSDLMFVLRLDDPGLAYTLRMALRTDRTWPEHTISRPIA